MTPISARQRWILGSLRRAVSRSWAVVVGTGAHLSCMKYHRPTDTGRRLSAEPVVKPEPDMRRLVALVLHLADTLHAEDIADARGEPDSGTGKAQARRAVQAARDDGDAAAPSAERNTRRRRTQGGDHDDDHRRAQTGSQGS